MTGTVSASAFDYSIPFGIYDIVFLSALEPFGIVKSITYDIDIVAK